MVGSIQPKRTIDARELPTEQSSALPQKPALFSSPEILQKAKKKKLPKPDKKAVPPTQPFSVSYRKKTSTVGEPFELFV